MYEIADETLAEYLQQKRYLPFRVPWNTLPDSTKHHWIFIAKKTKVDLKNLGFVTKPVE